MTAALPRIYEIKRFVLLSERKCQSRLYRSLTVRPAFSVGKRMLTDLNNEELCGRIQAGEDAQECLRILWAKNQGAVRKACPPYLKVYEFDDLMQEGFLALHEATCTYDSSQEALFSTWLVHMVKWHFSRWHGRQPDRQKELSVLDSPLSEEDGEKTVADLTAGDASTDQEAEENIVSEEVRETVKRCLDRLKPEEAEVVRARFFYQASLDTICSRMGLTKGQVETLRRNALVSLKRRHRRELRACLDELDEVRYSSGLRGTGYLKFNTTWTSSTERAAMAVLRKAERQAAEELLQQYVFSFQRRSQGAPLTPHV